jgi:hypothetical protein
MYKRLNSVYMRVLRRIAGACRFNAVGNKTDAMVRRELNMPSMQCLIVRRRLMLLMSVLRSEVKSLMALMAAVSARGDKSRLPWVELVYKDLCALARYHGDRLTELGDPRGDAAKWHRFIVDYPLAWRQLVAEFHYFDSSLDAAATSKQTSRLGYDCEHVCAACREAGCPCVFASEKALMCHQRSKHLCECTWTGAVSAPSAGPTLALAQGHSPTCPNGDVVARRV